jgi:hypothetical protein
MIKYLIKPFLLIKKINFPALLGCLFLIPPIFGVISFIVDIVSVSNIQENATIISGNLYVSTFWWGPGSDLPSQFPLYLGLMAIAGAYLIKSKK